jgi:hypothetical protein
MAKKPNLWGLWCVSGNWLCDWSGRTCAFVTHADARRVARDNAQDMRPVTLVPKEPK